MADFWGNVMVGYQVAFSTVNLLYCFAGVLVGTLIGVLPGIGTAGAIALLLPMTYGMQPVSAIIMLSGIWYGAQYGGSTTSILINIPGESSSVVTSLDGHQLARQGRAGPALGMAAFSSFIAGTFGIIVVMLVAEPLSKVALKFGPPEYFSLIFMAFTLVTYLAHGSMFKATIMALVGVCLGVIGMDVVQGTTRFDFGIMELQDGIGIIPICMGLFGVADIFSNLEKSIPGAVFKEKIRGLLPNLRDWVSSIFSIVRGTLIGFFLGVLPGGGVTIASFAAYAVEKRVSKHPEKFGTGVMEGVAGPEAANNAAASGAFIPLFTLGIPPNASMALFIGALMIHGLQPGPLLIAQHPEIFWGTVLSMYIGNVLLLVLNLPLIGLWVKLLTVPYRILFPLILLFCIIGCYSINYSVFDVNVMLIFGIIGYLLRKFDYEAAPLIMAFILTPLFERSLRQSLLMSAGSPSIFFTRPISLVFLSIAILLIFSQFFKKARRQPISASI